jgi:hypothetical protein
MYYLDLDTRKDKIYIADFEINKHSRAYLMEFQSRSMADHLLRKLNAGLIKGPMTSKENWKLIETVKEPLGEVDIYYFIGKI